jgi:Zn-dependent protease with chaperone function
VRPRALVWTYLAALIASAGATFLLLGSLFLHYLPHDYLTRVHLVCKTVAGCPRVLPIWANTASSFLLGGTLFGLTLFAVFALCSQLSCSSRRQLQWSRDGSNRPQRCSARSSVRAWVIDDPAPVSCTVGFLHPQVVVSTGLFAHLDDEEVDAVLAHEEGHVIGRDNVLTLVAQTVAMTFVLVPGVRMAFARLRRAQELAADEYARERTGDPLVVASSLQKFARFLVASAGGRVGMVTSLGFADEGNVTERIRGLLLDEVVPGCRRRLAVAAILLVLLFGSFAGSALAFTDVALEGAGESSCTFGVHAAPKSAPAPFTWHREPTLVSPSTAHAVVVAPSPARR